MEPQQNSKKREIIAALAVLIVVVAIVAAAAVANKKKADSDTAMVSTKSSTSATAPASSTDTSSANGSTSGATSSTSTYKDGDYSATGTYDSPGGTEHITVHVTLKNDVVTATSAKSGTGDPEAQEYQDDFISGYKQQVVGKDIGSISLSRVSGSSLTSQGFNNAVSQIKSEARQSA
jgi:cytoskeletal protein RodZ